MLCLQLSSKIEPSGFGALKVLGSREFNVPKFYTLRLVSL